MNLRLEGISKHYGAITALDDFTFTFPLGITGILGPNGAGKSTMMNLITDNVKRERGQIYFNDVEILDLGRSFRAQLGYMTQEQGMYDRFSAREFLYYIWQLKSIPEARLRLQIEELLQRLNLVDAAHRKVGTFSGGMRQRVLLCQALLGDPKVLILDEPSAGLDPGERYRMRYFIEELAVDRVVLLSTHIVSDIEKIAKQIVLINRGKLVASGSPVELLVSLGLDSLEDVYLKTLGVPNFDERV